MKTQTISEEILNSITSYLTERKITYIDDFTFLENFFNSKTLVLEQEYIINIFEEIKNRYKIYFSRKKLFYFFNYYSRFLIEKNNLSSFNQATISGVLLHPFVKKYSRDGVTYYDNYCKVKFHGKYHEILIRTPNLNLIYDLDYYEGKPCSVKGRLKSFTRDRIEDGIKKTSTYQYLYVQELHILDNDNIDYNNNLSLSGIVTKMQIVGFLGGEKKKIEFSLNTFNFSLQGSYWMDWDDEIPFEIGDYIFIQGILKSFKHGYRIDQCFSISKIDSVFKGLFN